MTVSDEARERAADQMARTTLAAEMDRIGPSWSDLGDRVEQGTNYANDEIHVSIAIEALKTVSRELLDALAALSQRPSPHDEGEEWGFSKWRESGLPSERDYIEDMARVGESLIERLTDNHPFLKNWHPMDDPAEIVTDLLNALDEAAAPKLDEGVSAGVKELRGLLAKAAGPPWFIAERPTNSGLLRIEDGRQHGMFPVTGEGHEIRLIVAAVNALPRLLTLIDGGGK